MSPETEYYTEKRKEGEEFQDYVVGLFWDIGWPIVGYTSQEYQLIGENRAGIEIKYDSKIRITGKLFIEKREKTDPTNLNYIPSGIERSDNTLLYAQGDYEKVYVMAKKHLQCISSQYDEIECKRKTSIGFLLPVERAERLSIFTLPATERKRGILPR